MTARVPKREKKILNKKFYDHYELGRKKKMYKFPLRILSNVHDTSAYILSVRSSPYDLTRNPMNVFQPINRLTMKNQIY